MSKLAREGIALFMFVALAGSAVSASDDRHRRDEALRHYRAGQAAMHTEGWPEAEKEFQTAIELDPLLEIAHYALGQTYMATKRYPEAIAAYVRCREVCRTGAALRISDRADAERRLADQVQALREEVRTLQSGRFQTANTPATIQRLEDQVRELERRRLRGVDNTPTVPAGISLALGSAYFRNSAFADAEREYRAALEVEPGLGEAHNNLAVVYMLTNRLPEAEAELKEAEKAGFQVNPGLRADLQRRRQSR